MVACADKKVYNLEVDQKQAQKRLRKKSYHKSEQIGRVLKWQSHLLWLKRKFTVKQFFQEKVMFLNQ